MNKTRVFGFAIIAAMILALFFFWRKREHLQSQAMPESSTNPTASVQMVHEGSQPQSSQRLPTDQSPAPPAVPTQTGTASTNNPEVVEAEIKQQFLNLFRTPISFYGRVLDQDEHPVANAEVNFEWNTLDETKQDVRSGAAHTKTDAAGFFSLEGQKGDGLDITVNKIGYYNLGSSPSVFKYASLTQPIFHPDPQNPVVFHLKKKGHGVPLITSQNGIRPDLSILVPTDGTPINVDLLGVKSSQSGPLKVAQRKPDRLTWKKASEWYFEMSMPTGGFVEYHDEQFPFEAPEGGYQPTIQYDFQKGQTNWATDISKDFYIRFGNPPVYGRLHLETTIGNSEARLTYAINPDGSRNLESP